MKRKKIKSHPIKILGILFLGALLACANCNSKPENFTDEPANGPQHTQQPITYITDEMIKIARNQPGCEKLAELLQSLQDGNGGDVNAPDATNNNYTPLHEAVMFISEPDNILIIKVLLELGANPNAKETSCGYTTLHLAIQNETAQVLALLLAQSGINVNEASKDKSNTVLHLAAYIGNLAAVQHLLAQQKTDKTIQNRAHETALDIAKSRLEVYPAAKSKYQPIIEELSR